jgi:hypothetical protein
MRIDVYYAPEYRGLFFDNRWIHEVRRAQAGGPPLMEFFGWDGVPTKPLP